MSFTFSTGQTPHADWREQGYAATYLVASKLTDPLCHAHELYKETLIVDALYPDHSESENWMRKGALMVRSSAYAFLSLFTTLPGAELRWIAQFLQNKPFIYFKGEAEESKMDHSLSLLSWNLCCMSGGYSITNGGVLPWSYRMGQLNEALLAQDADVICLYEIFDIQTALHLYQGLKESYTHFFFHIGPNTVGLSSGLFVASKLNIVEPLFLPFPQETFYGRGKYFKKGFFSFGIQQEGEKIVNIVTTHLQHSEIAGCPTQGEIAARQHAMEMILAHMKQRDAIIPCVLAGDLNLDGEEYRRASWQEQFETGEIKSDGFTWGGDQFCSAFTHKPPSAPLNLDHTLVMKGFPTHLQTVYVEAGFNGAAFNRDALSDHRGLLSIITFD